MFAIVSAYKLSTALIVFSLFLFPLIRKSRIAIVSYTFLFFSTAFFSFKLIFSSSEDYYIVYYNYIRFVSLSLFGVYFAFFLKYIERYPSYFTLFFILIFFSPFLNLWNIYDSNYDYYIKTFFGTFCLISAFSYSQRQTLLAFIITIISFIYCLSFLEKWLICVYFFVPILLISKPHGKHLFELKSIFIFILFVFCLFAFRNEIANLRGFDSFDEFVDMRVTRNALSDKNRSDKQVLGFFSDGGRADLIVYPLEIMYSDFGLQKFLFGLDISYMHPSGIPDHNLFTFFYSRGGVWVIVVFFYLYFVFASIYRHNLPSSRFYFFLLLHVLLNFFVGEAYGIPLVILIYSLAFSIVIKNMKAEI